MITLEKNLLFLWLTFIVSVLSVSGLMAAQITDRSGTQIHFEQSFGRIISLYPAHTENLVSLGLHKQLIGISPGDDFPAAIVHKPRFSYKDNPEKFLAADPDLILIRPMIEQGYPKLITQLRQAGIVVVSLQPTSVDMMYEYWQKLGKLTGRQKEAESMINSFRTELARHIHLVNQVAYEKRPKVYFESIHKRMKTFSPTSIPVFCLENGGGINVASDAKPRRNSNIASYGKEKILALAGKIDVFLAQVGRMNHVTEKMIEHEPGFMAIKAVRNKKIFLVDEKIVSRPTLRLLEGITTIYNLLYSVNKPQD